MDYHLQEGSLAIPEGFKDRTVNVFVLGDSAPATLSITVSRDDFLPAETMDTYIDRQMKLIAAKLRGYTILGKRSAQLSQSTPFLGVQVDAYYIVENRPLYQRQAAFELGEGRVLVFSTTSQSNFTKQQDENWKALLSSFQPRAALDGTEPVTQG